MAKADNHIPFKAPELKWKDNKLPISPVFEDSYYSEPYDGKDGRSECRAVFIDGNTLPQRWQSMTQCSIAELGFGTGLNFLETVQQWRNTAPKDATLYYTSFELYPLSPMQIDQALAPWPDLQKLGRQLLPHLLGDLYQKGWAHSKFNLEDNKTVCLSLAVGDANLLIEDWPTEDGRKTPHENMPQTIPPVSAWYLDGFSPAKNPQLWNAPLMNQVYNLTAPKGTFSTYTSAGHVRRALSEAGFDVQKVDGFGRKRHRLQGTKPDIY